MDLPVCRSVHLRRSGPAQDTLCAFIGFVAGLFDIIPYFGPVLGFLPAAALALSKSPLTVLWVLLLFVAANQIENSLISPWLIGDRVGLHPLAVIFAVLVGGLSPGDFGPARGRSRRGSGACGGRLPSFKAPPAAIGGGKIHMDRAAEPALFCLSAASLPRLDRRVTKLTRQRHLDNIVLAMTGAFCFRNGGNRVSRTL